MSERHTVNPYILNFHLCIYKKNYTRHLANGVLVRIFIAARLIHDVIDPWSSRLKECNKNISCCFELLNRDIKTDAVKFHIKIYNRLSQG